MDDTSRETNPYKEHIVNNAEKIEPLMTQMEQWSILSNILNYGENSRLHSMNHMLNIKAVDKYKYRPSADNKEFKELDLLQPHRNYRKNIWTYMREFIQK